MPRVARVDAQNKLSRTVNILTTKPNKSYKVSVEAQAMRKVMKGKEKVKGKTKDPKGWYKSSQGADSVALTAKADKVKDVLVTTSQGSFKQGRRLF